MKLPSCYCIIDKLLAHINPFIQSVQEEDNYITAMIDACKNGHKAVVELLIHKGANVNYQDKVR